MLFIIIFIIIIIHSHRKRPPGDVLVDSPSWAQTSRQPSPNATHASEGLSRWFQYPPEAPDIKGQRQAILYLPVPIPDL